MHALPARTRLRYARQLHPAGTPAKAPALPQGWEGIAERLLAATEALCPDGRLRWEWMGAVEGELDLRCHGHMPLELEHAADAACASARGTCEVCGRPGRAVHLGREHRVLCALDYLSHLLADHGCSAAEVAAWLARPRGGRARLSRYEGLQRWGFADQRDLEDAFATLLPPPQPDRSNGDWAGLVQAAWGERACAWVVLTEDPRGSGQPLLIATLRDLDAGFDELAALAVAPAYTDSLLAVHLIGATPEAAMSDPYMAWLVSKADCGR